MEKEIIIGNAIIYAKDFFNKDSQGHDYYHTIRVYETATKIAKKENADLFIVQLASLLHDVDDIKLVDSNSNNAYEFMKSQKLDEETISKVLYIIENQSFKKSIKSSIKLNSKEAMIVQDADRLDAIGALGIARAFAYGGSNKKQIYNPEIKIIKYETEKQYTNNNGTSINHFYEKLLKLKDLMNTDTAKKMAKHRHDFMEEFLAEFLAEWNGEK